MDSDSPSPYRVSRNDSDLASSYSLGAKAESVKNYFPLRQRGGHIRRENLGSSNDGVLDLMRRMTTEAAGGNFALTIKHVRGVDHGIADALSRFQEPRFRKIAPPAKRNPVPLPGGFWEELRGSCMT